MKSGIACADHRSAKRSSPRIARLLLLLSELVSCSSFDYQDVKLTKIVKFAIGWPLEDVAEENRARGSTPDALLDVGYQSLGYVEVSVGGGHLWPHGPYERTLYDASRAEGEIFCTQARNRASGKVFGHLRWRCSLYATRRSVRRSERARVAAPERPRTFSNLSHRASKRRH